MPFFVALVSISLVAWILVVWMVWKKKTNIFHEQIVPRSAEKRLKLLKASLLVAGISLVVGIVSFIVGIIILGYEEEAVIFYICLSSVLLFILGNVSGFGIYLTGRRNQT